MLLLGPVLRAHELGSTPIQQRLEESCVCKHFHHLMLLMVKASCMVTGELRWSPVPGSSQKTLVCSQKSQHMLTLDQNRLTQFHLKLVSAIAVFS